MATYTHGHGESVLQSHSWRSAKNSAGYLIPHLRGGLDLLDVGCGPGTITADLARLVAPGRVVGIDTAEEVLVRAGEMAAGRGITNALFEPADVAALPYADGSFDVVHAHQVLQHLFDPVAALKEMRRVLRPGGLLAVRDSDYGAMRWYPETPAFDRWRDIYCRVARNNGGDPEAGRKLASWVREAGFADLDVTTDTWCFADEDSRQWWGNTWAERIGSSTLSTQAIEAGVADQAELDEIAAAWRSWLGQRDASFVVLHDEVLARR